MNQTTKKIILLIGGVVFLWLGYYYLSAGSNRPDVLDGFAQCLSDKGLKFYGAFWCPHCQNQKALFGRSKRLLPYIECSTANGQGILPVCAKADVKQFPTWVYPDGTRDTGEVSLEKLAEKSSCALPK